MGAAHNCCRRQLWGLRQKLESCGRVARKLNHIFPNLERSGYFRFLTVPISLALQPATPIHLNQGTGFVSLPRPRPLRGSCCSLTDRLRGQVKSSGRERIPLTS